MKDEDWRPQGRARWIYRDYAISTDRAITATIKCDGRDNWHLFVNYDHVATFNSWEEARDATPMMLKLHGEYDDTLLQAQSSPRTPHV